MNTTISRIEAWACRVPLDSPITFRWKTITHRDYTVVRVHTVDGAHGTAIGLSRSLPVDVVIADLLAPNLFGLDALDVTDVADQLQRTTSTGDQYGIVAPARSLVDICLWDIRGKALGVPVWRLLGGNAAPAPVMLVEGYELPGETDEAFARRLADRVEQGYRTLKLEAAGYEDVRVLARRLELTRELVGDDIELVVDVNGAWQNVREAAAAINTFAHTGPAWVEDAFPKHLIGLTERLREAVDVPIGAGDEISNPSTLIGLLEADAVDYLRVDLTTLGGFVPTNDVVGAARQRGVPISTHAHPVFHQHLSAAWSTVAHVEAFPDDRPFEPSHRLARESVYSRIDSGFLPPSSEPGIGLELDLDLVTACAYRSHDLKGEV
ncbi:mandelate racemase/muconate lactonizing enzyme family protein [Saccharopolyspora hattusasensis]|uniref:mandelate racemase/muconate lactonizing enzyme family protein n=1 Tax=Saccharopolyspora hattusasensis TaxID=1128679 RepID=UPI003D97582B